MRLLSITFTFVLPLVLTQCEIIPQFPPSAPDPALQRATQIQPFTNSIGMKFVPVPGTKVLFCTTITTVAQYQLSGMSYQSPKFAQGRDHPAVNVSWNEAKAWCNWLSAKDGHSYRLPLRSEWRIASCSDYYPWGYEWPPPNNCGNYGGEELMSCTEAERALLFKGMGLIGGYRDRHKFTSPVGSYPANKLGLYDMGGNVWQWCENTIDLFQRDLHGGSWGDTEKVYLAGNFPKEDSPDCHSNEYGFRVVMVVQ